MSSPRTTRAARARLADSDGPVVDLRTLETSQKTRNSKHSKKTQYKKKLPSNITTRNGSLRSMATEDGGESDEDDSDTDQPDNENESQAQPDVFAPSRDSSVSHDLAQAANFGTASWAGLDDGERIADDDQVSISDLDMHGSISSESMNEDELDDESVSDENPLDEDIDVNEDDDDYGDVDNISDTSEHSAQFEAEVEAAWAVDGIDWNDEEVYQYDESRSGFLADEEFLNGLHLAQAYGADWQIQFLDFGHRAAQAPQIIEDVSMADSPLVRKVDEMNGRTSRTNSDSLESTTTSTSQSIAQSTSTAGADSQIDVEDDAGDTTDDDLPDESTLPSPITQQQSLRKEDGSASTSAASSQTFGKRIPVMSRMPIDVNRATATSVKTPEGKFVRRVNVPISSRTAWVIVSGPRSRVQPDRGLDVSPTGTLMSLDDSDYEYQTEVHSRLTGRLFQQAHFGYVYNPEWHDASPTSQNSFWSGPALHRDGPAQSSGGLDDRGSVPRFLQVDHEVIAELIDFDGGNGDDPEDVARIEIPVDSTESILGSPECSGLPNISPSPVSNHRKRISSDSTGRLDHPRHKRTKTDPQAELVT